MTAASSVLSNRSGSNSLAVAVLTFRTGTEVLTCEAMVSRAVPWLARAHLQPGQPACGPVHRHQQAEQGRHLGSDTAGAIVQQDSEPASERAAFAEPSAQQLALHAAARAIEGLRELCAGGADRGAVAGPQPWKGTVLAASRTGAPCAHRAV